MRHVQQIDEHIRFDCSKLFNWTTFKTWILRGHDQARNTSVLLHEGHITEDILIIYRCDFPVIEINSLARTQTFNL